MGAVKITSLRELCVLGDAYRGRRTYRLFNINERFNEVESTRLYRDSVLIREDVGVKRARVRVKQGWGGWVNAITIRATATASLLIKSTSLDDSDSIRFKLLK